MTIDEFEQWITTRQVARTVLFLQEHHTFSPSYANFNGKNHFSLLVGMKNYHVNYNGWADIGQHFTTFPDGMIATGRSLELSPACIKGRNANAICIENIGNFDSNKDAMSPAHRDTIVRSAAAIEDLLEKYRQVVPRLEDDRILSEDMERTVQFLK